MNPRLIDLLLKCYPARWRSEYGAELADILRRQLFRPGTVANVLFSALQEQLRTSTAFLLIAGATFLIAVVFADPLWRYLTEPVVTYLQNQRAVPPNLISDSPFQQFGVFRLGLPLLFSLITTYPCALLLIWAQRRANRFTLYSMICFVLSVAAGLTAWQHDSIALLSGILPEHAPFLTVGRFFILLAASTLAPALLLQIPLLAWSAARHLRNRKQG